MLKILTEGNPILRQKSKSIAKISKRTRDLAKNMLETMYNAQGVGLAAPQIGVLERLIVVDTGEGPHVLINPSITEKSGVVTKDVEGCLSIPGRNEYITRADKVSVTYYSLDGKEMAIEGCGLLARALQHEIDHLDGILFIDYLKEES